MTVLALAALAALLACAGSRRGCPTALAAAVAILAVTACCSAADNATVSFAAMAQREAVAQAPAAVEPCDFRAMRQPAPAVTSSAADAVSFAAMAQRRPVRPTASTKPAPQAAPPQSHLLYWHTDGRWRPQPQVGLTYNPPGVVCVGANCYLR